MTRRTTAFVPATLLALLVASAAAAQERAPVPRPDSSHLFRWHLLGVALPSELALRDIKIHYELGPLTGAGADVQLEGPSRSRVTWRVELALLTLRGDLDVAYDLGYTPVRHDDGAEVTVRQAGLGLRFQLLERRSVDLHLSPMLYWQSFDVDLNPLGGFTFGVELGLDFRPPPGRAWFWTAALRPVLVSPLGDSDSSTMFHVAVGLGRAF